MVDAHREQQLRIQALGAALSRRDWHATEQAYNAIRDHFDANPAPSPRVSEPVAWTNEAQLAHLKNPAYASVPMAMWQGQSESSPIALYATPPSPSAGREEIARIKDRIDTRLNNVLCEMKEGWDDSVVGFNEAWDIVRAVFKDELGG